MAPRKKTATAEKPSPIPAEVKETLKPTAGADPADVLAGSKIIPEGFLVDKERHLVIDKSVFDRDQFSEEQRGNIAAINYCDQRLASLNQDMKTMQLGRDSMVKNLIDSIKDLTPVAIYQPE